MPRPPAVPPMPATAAGLRALAQADPPGFLRLAVLHHRTQLGSDNCTVLLRIAIYAQRRHLSPGEVADLVEQHTGPKYQVGVRQRALNPLIRTLRGTDPKEGV
jgi:hypothetical protein